MFQSGASQALRTIQLQRDTCHHPAGLLGSMFRGGGVPLTPQLNSVTTSSSCVHSKPCLETTQDHSRQVANNSSYRSSRSILTGTELREGGNAGTRLEKKDYGASFPKSLPVCLRLANRMPMFLTLFEVLSIGIPRGMLPNSKTKVHSLSALL
mmetsp:Transcript_8879/g.16723  ORF Transcript_8879/g.16723 Transcript_8879/m.16723 type:complete len:153 (+) Transcript_8879:164-622(+)